MGASIDASEVRRALTDPVRIAERLGLAIVRRQRDGVIIRCPAPDHRDSDASCSVRIGPDGTIQVRCFGCALRGDIYTLIAASHGLDARHDFPRLVELGAELAGIAPSVGGSAPRPRPAPAPRPEPPRCSDEGFSAIAGYLRTYGELDQTTTCIDVWRYLASRGLLAAARRDGWHALPPTDAAGRRTTASWLSILHGETSLPDPRWTAADLDRCGLLRGSTWMHPEHRLCIPWRSPDGRDATLQRRRLDDQHPRYVMPAGRPPEHPYGAERLVPGLSIVWVEGAIDVLALRELDRRAGLERCVLGLPGTEGWRDGWAALVAGRDVVIATDADAAGDRAAATIAADCWRAGATSVRRMRSTDGDWTDRVERG